MGFIYNQLFYKIDLETGISFLFFDTKNRNAIYCNSCAYSISSLSEISSEFVLWEDKIVKPYQIEGIRYEANLMGDIFILFKSGFLLETYFKHDEVYDFSVWSPLDSGYENAKSKYLSGRPFKLFSYDKNDFFHHYENDDNFIDFVIPI